jgi:hypothetical protein
MSEGENMFAFQICDITQTDQKICHCEFLGCIAEDVEDEDNVESEMSDNKRGELRLITISTALLSVLFIKRSYLTRIVNLCLLGINDNGTDDADACAHDSKRLKRIPS